MYLSRIRLRPNAASLSQLANLKLNDDYRVHQHIWGLFSRHNDQARDWLYRNNPNANGTEFFTVSNHPPQDDSGLWAIDSKPYAPQLHAGDSLSFVLTANPVVTKRDKQRKQHRHDVVMDLKAQFDKDQRPPQADIIQQAASQWLSKRGQQAGFEINAQHISAEAYTQHRLRKRHRQDIRFSSVEFSGLLTITDSEKFIHTLYNGLGPAKGFGCGLMLVRRV